MNNKKDDKKSFWERLLEHSTLMGIAAVITAIGVILGIVWPSVVEWRKERQTAMVRATETAQAAEVTPTKTPTWTPTITVAPSATPTPCPGLDPIFQSIADQVKSLRPRFTDLPDVGCPKNQAQTFKNSAWQKFLMHEPGSTVSNPPGYMIWRPDSLTIYVVLQGDSTTGRSEVLIYDDTWRDWMDETPPSCAGLTPPRRLKIPIRGFGKVWCDNKLYDVIGFGRGSENEVDLRIQETERGLYIRLPEVGNFVIDLVKKLALFL